MVTSPCLNNLFQADLIVLDKLGRQNQGYKYLLTIIDLLSRFAFIYPLKTKTGKEVSEAFDRQFTLQPCKYLQVDAGKEFYNSFVKRICEKHNVSMFSTHSNKKAAVVERFNQTIMRRIQRYLTHNKTKKYINVLQNLLSTYNNTFHSTIKMKPSEVDERNQHLVWFNSFKQVYDAKQTKPFYKKDDFVRIVLNKNVFDKGYKQSYTDKIWRVKEVHNTVPITYTLWDGTEDILGIFYKEELSKVNK